MVAAVETGRCNQAFSKQMMAFKNRTAATDDAGSLGLVGLCMSILVFFLLNRLGCNGVGDLVLVGRLASFELKDEPVERVSATTSVRKDEECEKSLPGERQIEANGKTEESKDVDVAR